MLRSRYCTGRIFRARYLYASGPPAAVPQVIVVNTATSGLTAQPVTGAGQQRLVSSASTGAVAQPVLGAQQTRQVPSTASSHEAQLVPGAQQTRQVTAPTSSLVAQLIPGAQQRLVTQAMSADLSQSIVRQLPATLIQTASQTDTAQRLMGLPNLGIPFTATETVTIPADMHGLLTPDLLMQVYDDRVPAHQIQPGRVTIDATSLEVEITFAQAQSGYVVLNNALAPLGYGNVQVPIMGETVTILGTQHGLRTKNLLVVVYDGQTPAHAIHPGQVTIHPTTYTVVVTFAQPQSGYIVLCGYSSSGEVPNVSVDFPAALSWTVPGTLHQLATNQLVAQAYTDTTPRVRVQPGSLTVDPLSYDVVATFAQAQGGTLVLNGSKQQLLRLVTTAPATDTSQLVRWAPQHRLIVTALDPLTAQPVLGAAATRMLSAALELAVSQVVAWSPLQRFVNTSSMLQAAQLIAWAPQQRLVSPGVTTEVLLPLIIPAIRLIGQTTESAAALSVTLPSGLRLVETSGMSDIAPLITWAPKSRFVTTVLTTAVGQLVSVPTMRLVSHGLESAAGQNVTVPTGVRLVDTSLDTVSAQALAGGVTRLIVAGLMTDQSGMIHWAPQHRLVALSMETLSARPIVSEVTRFIDVVGTTDTTLSLEVLTPRFVQTALASHLSQAVLWTPRSRFVATSSHVEQSQVIVAPRIRFVTASGASEQSQAVLWTPRQRFVASSVDVGLAQDILLGALTRLVLPGQETGQGQSIQWSPRSRFVGTSPTLAQSQLVAWHPQRLVGMSTMTAVGQSILWAPITRLIQPSSEEHQSQAIPFDAITRLVRHAPESEYSLSAGGEKISLVFAAETQDTATGLFVVRFLPLTPTLETDAALSVLWRPQQRFVGTSLETDLATLIMVSAGILFGGIYGEWSIAPLIGGEWEAEPVIGGEWEAEPVIGGLWQITDDVEV